MNDNHRLVIVASTLDDSTQRIVEYLLEDYGVPVNVVFFRYFRDGDSEYLGRSWLKDPDIAEERARRREPKRTPGGSRDYTRYDLTIGDQTLTRMSKQAAVKIAIQGLYRAGVSLAQIKAATYGSRWVAVHPAAGQIVEDAFRREYPSRSPNHLWYDLGITEGDTIWVIPRFGGRRTEQILDGLANIASPNTALTWSASDASPEGDEGP
jgi:hypothetical protein